MKIKNTKTRAFRVILYVVLIALALVMLVPFAWMLSASFKLDKDVFIFPIQWIPENPRWQNYVDIWHKIPLSKFVLNTVKLTLIVTFLQLLTSSFAAYAFAKLQFKGKNTLFLAYITTIAVPWQVYMVPQFMMMRSFGLADTHLAIICLQAFSAFGVFMMKQFSENIPTSLLEAARIDGAGELTTFLQVAFPIIKPGFGALAIFTFINSWNEYPLQLVMLTQSEAKTISLGIASKLSEMSNDYGLIMAGAALASVPIILVFLRFQKYFTQGITMGAVKG